MSRTHGPVIVGATYWTLNGVNIFSANLVRGLRARGMAAEILLTEQDTDLITITEAPMPRPADVPMAALPVEPWQSWGAHWGAMVRYLEDRAPCVYIPNSDWRHSCVSPLLSDAVRIAGVVHSDDPMHYDHVKRLGRYWDAMVTTSPAILRKTIAIDPTYADRTRVIPIGVNVPAEPPRRTAAADVPLRVIYAGMLKQHQKRILDLPKIIDAAVRRGIPLTVTIAGSGPQEGDLREACAAFVESGIVRFAGLVEHSALLALLETHDVFIMMSAFEGMPNALLEAMGRGVVPLVTDIESGIADVVEDGRNGHVVPVGAIDRFVDRLEHLARDVDDRQRAAARAYATVVLGKFRIDDMVDAYAALCAGLLDPSRPATFGRPHGPLNHPPRDIDGIGLFPVALEYDAPGIGAFQSWLPDYREFGDEIRALKHPQRSRVAGFVDGRRSLSDLQVIMGWPQRTASVAGTFAVPLARDLIAQGLDTHLLVTEEDTELVELNEPVQPSLFDVPCQRLPVERHTSWGGHWGATLRHLEAHAPCIYFPNHDWRHACVTPVLSDRVAVVAVVNDANDVAHAQRLGRYWNALVTWDPGIAATLRQEPELAPRVFVLPTPPDRAGRDYLELFAKILDDVRHGLYRRPPGTLQPPPHRLAGQQIFSEEWPFEIAANYAPAKTLPRVVEPLREFHEYATGGREPLDLVSANGVQIVVGLPIWEPSGVGDFAVTLVRELAAGGVAARLLLTEEDTDLVPRPPRRSPLPAGVRIDRLPVERHLGWGAHWGVMVRYLEDLAPCIYLPNDDWRHACIAPLLSDAVVVIGLLHGDDALHAEQLQCLGAYWNAVVTYDADVAHRAVANAATSGRVYSFPYRRTGLAANFRYLFNIALGEARDGAFSRPHGVLRPPPRALGGVDIFPADLAHHEPGVGWFPHAGDYAEFARHVNWQTRSKQSRSQTV